MNPRSQPHDNGKPSRSLVPASPQRAQGKQLPAFAERSRLQMTESRHLSVPRRQALESFHLRSFEPHCHWRRARLSSNRRAFRRHVILRRLEAYVAPRFRKPTSRFRGRLFRRAGLHTLKLIKSAFAMVAAKVRIRRAGEWNYRSHRWASCTFTGSSMLEVCPAGPRH
jgi:hypothetical protein